MRDRRMKRRSQDSGQITDISVHIRNGGMESVSEGTHPLVLGRIKVREGRDIFRLTRLMPALWGNPDKKSIP